MPLINLQNVHCNISRGHYFSELNWRYLPQQHWAIVGGNGAGKTALARIIDGSLTIASGTRNGEALKGICNVSFDQQHSLMREQAKRDNSNEREDATDRGLSVGEYLHPMSCKDPLAKLTSLDVLWDRGIKFLSSGQIRKLLIVEAIAKKPSLLILDEPMEGLDQASRPIVTTLINTAAKQGTPIILLLRDEHNFPACISHVLQLANLTAKFCGTLTEFEKKRLSNYPQETIDSLPLAISNATHRKFDHLVKMRNIEVHYGATPIFKAPEFSLQAQQHTLLTGPNGCGKSTLLNLIIGENHQAYGQSVVLFDRQKGSGESVWEIKQHIGLVSNDLQARFQQGWRCLDVVLSGFQDSIGVRQLNGDQQQLIARQWLAKFALEQDHKSRFDRLSFGAQKMVLLARAMVKNPPLLILDEPFTGLDPNNKQRLIQTLDLIAAQSLTTILLVSHVAEERPACITSHYSFQSEATGGFQLLKEAIEQ